MISISHRILVTSQICLKELCHHKGHIDRFLRIFQRSRTKPYSLDNVPKMIHGKTPDGYQIIYYAPQKNTARALHWVLSLSVISMTITPLYYFTFIENIKEFIDRIADPNSPYIVVCMVLQAGLLFRLCGKYTYRIYKRLDDPNSYMLINHRWYNPIYEKQTLFKKNDIGIRESGLGIIFGQLRIKNKYYIISQNQFVSAKHYNDFFGYK